MTIAKRYMTKVTILTLNYVFFMPKPARCGGEKNIFLQEIFFIINPLIYEK